eukprot:COSAG05_NODE_1110_length_5859_cov_26.008507_5_plen_83_part_00
MSAQSPPLVTAVGSYSPRGLLKLKCAPVKIYVFLYPDTPSAEIEFDRVVFRLYHHVIMIIPGSNGRAVVASRAVCCATYHRR